jgi:membrane protein
LIMKLLARLAALFLAFKTYKATRDGIHDPAQRAMGRVSTKKERSSRATRRSRRTTATVAQPGPAASSPTTAREEPIPPQRAGEPGPDTPLQLQPSDWKATGKRTLKEIKEDRVTLVAAGMAYYFFLAIFPAVIAVVGVLGLIHASEATVDSITSSIDSTFPGDSGTVLTQAIDNAKRPSDQASLWAAVIGIALAVWSASAGFVHLQSALNVAYDVPQDRKFVAKRAVALGLLVATGLLGGVPSPFFTFGESTIFVVLGWALTVLAVIALFSLYYFVAPNRGSPTWHWVSPGGLVGAFLWITASVAFRLYVANFDSYGKTYGSIAGVVILILWIFITCLSILVGGELNAELERQAEHQTPAVPHRA